MKRHGKANIEQRNWRSWKRGKEWVFGCSLFLSLGATSMVVAPTTAHAEQMIVDSDEKQTHHEAQLEVSEASEEAVAQDTTEAPLNQEEGKHLESTQQVEVGENVTNQAENVEKATTSAEKVTLPEAPLTSPVEEVGEMASPFRNSRASSPTSTHSRDGLRITKGQYDIEFTDTGELASRAGKGDIGFVKLNDSAAAYLFNFGDPDTISLEELRSRLILRPRNGGAPVLGSDTVNYRIVDEAGKRYFKDSQNRNVEALYLVSITPSINTNINHRQRLIGTKPDGDGGEGKFNRLVPLNVNIGSNSISIPGQRMVTSEGFYSYSLYLGDRIVPGIPSHTTSMDFYMIAIDNKRPVVDTAATKANFERALGDSHLNKDNIDTIMTLNNVEVTDNVLNKATLRSTDYTNVFLRDEQGREHTVAGLKELLSGPTAADYANKNYTVIIKTSDLPNATGSNLVSFEDIIMGVVDKKPLQDAQERATTVNTTANTQNQSLDSVAAYNAAIAAFNNAKQQAQSVFDNPRATVEEILNAISTLNETGQQVDQKATQLVPAQAYVHQVASDRLVKFVTEAVTEEELKQTITNLPNGATIVLNQAFVNPNAIGEHVFNATITYADRSTKQVQLILVQNKDPRALQAALEQLIASMETPVVTENKAPNKVATYREKLQELGRLRDSIQMILNDLNQPENTQDYLNMMTEHVKGEIRDLTAKREAITDAMAFLYPINQAFSLEKKVTDNITEADLIVITAGIHGHPVVSLNAPFVKPNSEGTYSFEATARYSDGSSNPVTFNLRLVTDWTLLEQISSNLNAQIGTSVVRQDKNPLAVAAYDEAVARARQVYTQLQTLRQSGSTNQAVLNGALPFLQQKVNELLVELQEKRQAITPSLASQYPVAQPNSIVRSIKNPASEKEILGAVTLPEHAQRVEFAPNTNRQWDNTQTYQVAVDVVYSDTSVNRVTVQYTLNKEWSLLEEAANLVTSKIQELEANADLLVDKRPSTVSAYQRVLQQIKGQLNHATNELQHKSANTQQRTIDYYENQLKESLAQLEESVRNLVPSEASLYTPTAEKVIRTTKTLANAKTLSAVVSNYPDTASVVIAPHTVPTTKGTHTVRAQVVYQDHTMDFVDITYIINLDFTAANQAKEMLENLIVAGHGDRNLDEKTKASVANYRAKLAEAISAKEQFEALVADPNTEQSQLDSFLDRLTSARIHLQNAVQFLVDSEATRITPTVNKLVRDTNTLATAQEIANNVRVMHAYGYQLALSPGQEVPSSEGEYRLRVTVTYRDESSEEVEVEYTVNTYKRRLEKAAIDLNNAMKNTPVLSNKSPATVEAYEQALAHAHQIIQEGQAIVQAVDSTQRAIDEAERNTTEALTTLIQARDALELSQAAIHTPRMERLEKTMRDTIELADIRAHLQDIPEQTQITTNQEIVKREGSNLIELTVHYPDRSTETVHVYYYYTTVKTDLIESLATLRQQIIERPVTSDMRPNTVENYNDILREAERLHRQENNRLLNNLTQVEIDEITEQVKAISKQLQAARDALAIKDSVTYPVQNGRLTTTIKRLATDEQLIEALGDLPGGATAEITHSYGKFVGVHYVAVKLTYPDDSTNIVNVEYTITLHKEDLANVNTALEAAINQDVNLENVSPRAIRLYQEVKRAQQNELTYGKYIHDSGLQQHQLDQAVIRMETAKEHMLEAIRGLVPSEAFTTTPTNGALTRTVKQTVTIPELLQTIGGLPDTARVALAPDVAIPRNEVKTHILNAIVTYQDDSTDQVEIHLTLTTDLTALNQEQAALETMLATQAETEGKRPATVEAYQEARLEAQAKLAAAQQVAQDPTSTQATIDQATQVATQARERLRTAAANIVDSDATKYTPNVTELTRTMKRLALENDVLQSVTVQGAVFTTTLASAMALPNSVGKHKVRVQILYGDRSRGEVDVPYIITVDTDELVQKNMQLHNMLQQAVDTTDKTRASIEHYEMEKQRVAELLATARNVAQTETQNQQRIDEEAENINRALQDLQAAVNQLTDTQAKLINPATTYYRTDARNLASIAQLVQAVSIPQATNYQVSMPNYTDNTLPTEIGTHVLMATVMYQDDSSEPLRIEYTIAPYQDELVSANNQLNNKLSESVETDQKRPATITRYEQALAHARQVQAATQRLLNELASGQNTTRQAMIDEQTRATNEANTRLVAAIEGLEDSDAKTYSPTAQPLTRTLKHLANTQELVQQVSGYPQNATVTINPSSLPQQVGTHRIVATVSYNDQTSERVEILYTITTDKEALAQAIESLAQTDGVSTDLIGIRPSDIEQYHNAKQQAKMKLAEARALFQDNDASQNNIDALVEAVNATQAALHYAQTHLNPSEATLYEPSVSAITRTIRDLATVEQVKASVTVPGAQGYQVNLENSVLPNVIGVHQINATIVYTDNSSERVSVTYTITTDKVPLANANDALKQALASIQPSDTQDMSPVTVAAFEQAQQMARDLLEEARHLYEAATEDQAALDQMVERLAHAQAKIAETKAALRQAQAVSIELAVNPLVVTVKNLANADEVKARVTNLPEGAQVILANEQLPTLEGVHAIAATVHYADSSTKAITIRYEITSDKTDLAATLALLNTEKTQIATTDGMKPQAIEDYRAAQDQAIAIFEQAQATLNAPNSKQADLDVAQRQVEAAIQRLQQAKQALVPSLATLTQPQEREITRTVTNLANQADIVDLISSQTLPQGTQFELQNADSFPTNLGTHSLTVKVIYTDRSEDMVMVRYTITTDTSVLEATTQHLIDELAKVVDTTGKRQSTLDALERARQAAEDELASAQEVLKVAGPTQVEIEAAIRTLNEKLAQFKQAVDQLEDSYATRQTPINGALERTVKQPATLEEIVGTVTVPEGLQSVTLAPNVTLPNTVGRYELDVVVTYTDQSTDTAVVVYTITTHKADLIAANEALQAIVNQPVATAGKRASTIEQYQQVKERVAALLASADATVNDENATQDNIDSQLVAINQAQTELRQAIANIVDADATTYHPTVTPLVRKTNNLATAQEIANRVQVAGATNVSIQLKADQVVPQSEGVYSMRVVVTYADASSEEIEVPYTIETYKGDLDNANTLLADKLSTKAELGHRSPSTAANYNKVWDQVSAILQETQATFAEKDASQADIDAATERAKAALAQLEAATQQLQDAMAHTHQPTIAAIEKTTRETITQEDLRQAISDVPLDAVLILQEEMTHNEGDNQVTGIIRYADGSTEPVTLHYTYNRVTDELSEATNALNTRVHTPADTQNMRPATIEAYQQALQEAQTILQETNAVLNSGTATQAQIDQATQRANDAKTALDTAIANLTVKDSVQYPVTDGNLETTIKALASEQQLVDALGQLPTQVQSAVVTGTYPVEPGTHAVAITLTYQDGSTQVVHTNYTITLHKATLADEITHLQQLMAQPVIRDNMSPKAIRAYDKVLADEQAELLAAQEALNNATQQELLDAMVTRVQEAMKRVQAAIAAVVPSLASQTNPIDSALTRTVKQPAEINDITQLISAQNLPANTRVELQGNVPTALGEHPLTIKVIYADDSEDQVTVRYTVTTYTNELEIVHAQLAAELAKEVSTEGKRKATIDTLNAAKQAVNEVLQAAQNVLNQAGPTQAIIETMIADIREKMQGLQQAVAGLEDAYATLYTPTNGRYERTVKQPVHLADILATVTTPGGNPTIQLPDGVSLPTEVGTHTVEVRVIYDDQSVDTATIQYTITTHKADLAGANQVLQAQIERVPSLEGKRQSTVDAYNQAKQTAEAILLEAETIISNPNATQNEIDAVLVQVNNAKANLEQVSNEIVDADATTYVPNDGVLTVKATQLATKEQLEATITVDGVKDIQVFLDQATPPTEVGAHRLEATVLYADGSSEKAYVHYTIELDTDAVQIAKNQLQQKLAEYVKESDRSQATLNQYQLAKQAAENVVALSEQFLADEAATAKQPAADALARQLENAYAELINAIAGLRDSQASTNQPIVAKLTRTLKDAFEQQNLLNQVTNLPEGARVVINEETAIPTEVGEYQVVATIHYADQSTKAIEIPYEITTYTDELTEAQRQLQAVVDNVPTIDDKSPVAVRHYQALLAEAQQQLAQAHAYLENAATSQPTLNDATAQLQHTKEQLVEAIRAIVDSQAKLHEPQVTDMRTKVTSPVTAEQLMQQVVAVPGANVQLQLPNDAILTTVGRHEIPVQITYEDESVDRAVLVLVVEVDPAALNTANRKLQDFLAGPVDTAMKSPDSLAAYQEALLAAQDTLRHSQNIATTEVNEQAKIDEAKLATEQALAHLQAAIDQLVPSEASQNTPMSEGLVRTMRQPADKQILAETVKELPNHATVQITGDMPTTEGNHQVEALIIYSDRSTETILIPYTLYADKTDLAEALAQLATQLQQENDTNDKQPDAIDAYHQARMVATQALEAGRTTLDQANPTQVTVDETAATLQNVLRELQSAIRGLVPSQAATTTLTDGHLQRHVNDKATASELKAQIGDLPSGATATIQEVPQTVGRHDVTISVLFADRSVKQFTVSYEIILDKAPLMQANDVLAQVIATEVVLDDKSPATAQRYRDAKAAAIQAIEATRVVYANEIIDQANVDAAVESARQATDQLQQAIRDLTISQATHYAPTGQRVERTMRTLASEAELAQAIEGKPADATVELLTAVPREEGIHTLHARLTYADQSTDDVTITYVVQTVKTDLMSAIETLTRQLDAKVNVAGKRPATIAEYERVKALATELISQAHATLLDDTVKQATLDATTALVNQMRTQLTESVENIVDSDATTTPIAEGTLLRTTSQLANKQALIDTLTDKPNSATAEIQDDLPTEVGDYRVPIVITFADGSTKQAYVQYQIRPDVDKLSEETARLLQAKQPDVDTRYYTPESLTERARLAQALKDQVAAGQMMLNDMYTPQQAVDRMVDALQQAEANLKQHTLVLNEAGKNKDNLHEGLLTRTVRQLATIDELGATIGRVPENATFSTESVLPNQVGVTRIKIKVNYADGSQDVQCVHYTITTDKGDLTQLADVLTQLVATPVETEGKRPSTVSAYEIAREQAKQQLANAQAIHEQSDATQAAIEQAEQQLQVAIAALQQATAQVVDSDATTHEPTVTPITTTIKQLVTAQTLIDSVQIPANIQHAAIELEPGTLPTTVGIHTITAHVTYPDTTQDTVTIPYTITTDKQTLQQANNQLVDKLIEPVDLADISPMTLAMYKKALATAEDAQQLAAMTLADSNQYGDQAEIDAREQAVIAAQVALEAAIQQLKKSESFLHTPTATNITRSLKQLANREELTALVTDIPPTATVELENVDVLPNTVGEHKVNFHIRYADGTEERIHTLYTIQTYKDELESTVDSLKQLVERDTNLTDKAPLTVGRYQQAIEAATLQLVAAQAVLEAEQTEQAPINEAEQLVAQANEQLKAAIQALVDSQAKTNRPYIEPISRTAKQLASAQDILTQIKGLPETAKVMFNEATLPTVVGKHAIKVQVQYEDLSTKELVIEYTVTSVKDKLTEAENNLKQRLADVATAINHHPRITSKFDAIQQNIQQHLAQAQQILSNPDASQEAIDSAEATMIMLEAQLQLLMIDVQSDAVESTSPLQIAQPTPSNECPTCVETQVQAQSKTVGYTQLPAIGEMDTNLLAYTVATLTGLAGVVLGRKKKEDETE